MRKVIVEVQIDPLADISPDDEEKMKQRARDAIDRKIAAEVQLHKKVKEERDGVRPDKAVDDGI